MNVDCLQISFLLGTAEKIFLLPLKSVKKLEAAGIVLRNTYELDISLSSFSEFYKYVRDKYGVLYEDSEVVATEPLVPNKAEIEQIEGKKGYYWQHLLVIKDNFSTEKIVFYPYICQIEEK